MKLKVGTTRRLAAACQGDAVEVDMHPVERSDDTLAFYTSDALTLTAAIIARLEVGETVVIMRAS